MRDLILLFFLSIVTSLWIVNMPPANSVTLLFTLGPKIDLLLPPLSLPYHLHLSIYPQFVQKSYFLTTKQNSISPGTSPSATRFRSAAARGSIPRNSDSVSLSSSCLSCLPAFSSTFQGDKILQSGEFWSQNEDEPCTNELSMMKMTFPGSLRWPLWPVSTTRQATTRQSCGSLSPSISPTWEGTQTLSGQKSLIRKIDMQY